MADIEMTKSHNKDKETVKKAVNERLTSLASSMGLKINWDNDVAHLTGTGVKSAQVIVDDSSVKVQVDLALFAKAMKGMIEGTIEKQISKALA